MRYLFKDYSKCNRYPYIINFMSIRRQKITEIIYRKTNLIKQLIKNFFDNK